MELKVRKCKIISKERDAGRKITADFFLCFIITIKAIALQLKDRKANADLLKAVQLDTGATSGSALDKDMLQQYNKRIKRFYLPKITQGFIAGAYCLFT